MTKIKHYVDQIDDELCGAKEYAEKYVESKAAGNSNYATKYKEMAMDELKHANYVHDIATADIDQLSRVFKPTLEMQETWDKSHINYVEKAAWIKQMLAM